jgi:hypothetical protein
MEIIKAEQRSAHYYTQQGDPCFEVQAKTTGNMRKPTVKDARALDWLPSITTIIKNGMPTAYGIDIWKLDMLAQVILTSPAQKVTETYEEYINRLNDEYQDERSKSAKLGSEIHKGIDCYLKSQICEISSEAQVCVEKAKKWLRAKKLFFNLATSEQILISTEYGFAGTCDYIGQNIDDVKYVIDWKSQNLKNGNPKFYKEMLYQLGAFTILVSNASVYMNVIIPTNEDITECYSKVWSIEELSWGRNVFLQALKLYRLLYKFPYRKRND